MGLFDFIMKGMGFEGGEPDSKDKKKSKTKEQTSMIPKEKYQNFESGLASTFSSSQTDIPTMPNFNSGAGGKNMVIYAPRNNKDIQVLVDSLRRHEACIVNLGMLQPSDAERILDFLAGAAYALKGGLKRLQGDLFLLTPEGINIMTQK